MDFAQNEAEFDDGKVGFFATNPKQNSFITFDKLTSGQYKDVANAKAMIDGYSLFELTVKFQLSNQKTLYSR